MGQSFRSSDHAAPEERIAANQNSEESSALEGKSAEKEAVEYHPPVLHYKLSMILGSLLLLLTIAVIAKGHLLWALLTGLLGLFNLIPGIIIAKSEKKRKQKKNESSQ